MLVNIALIGLREGIEGCFVVTTLVALLVHGGRRDALAAVRAGIVGALLITIAAGASLAAAAAEISMFARDLFVGVSSVVAVALVTGVIFWMRHPVHAAESELSTRLSAALGLGTSAVFAFTFLTIMREGLEASIFVIITADTWRALFSLVAGIAFAAVLSWLLYRGVVRVSISRLLTTLGFVLIFVAAGILAEGAGALQQTGAIPGRGPALFDIGGVMSDATWYGSAVRQVLNYPARPTPIVFALWLGYLAGVLLLFVLVLRKTRRAGGRVVVPSIADGLEPDSANRAQITPAAQ